MNIRGYGEDGVTLWAVQKKPDRLIELLGDKSDVENCTVLYRPSFGRGITGIGEFDFILMTEKTLYLGESKWVHSPNRSKTEYPLDSSQLNRHKAFRIYLNTWLLNGEDSWEEYSAKLKPLLQEIGVFLVPKKGTQFQMNIEAIFRAIVTHFKKERFEAVDLLLFFVEENYAKKIPARSKEGFRFITMEYPKSQYYKFIDL